MVKSMLTDEELIDLVRKIVKLDKEQEEDKAAATLKNAFEEQKNEIIKQGLDALQEMALRM